MACVDCGDAMVGVMCEVCGSYYCPHCWMVCVEHALVLKVCRCMNPYFYSDQACMVARHLVQVGEELPCPIRWVQDDLERGLSVKEIMYKHHLKYGRVHTVLRVNGKDIKLNCAPHEFVKYLNMLEGFCK
jgi:hypothetical protein